MHCLNNYHHFSTASVVFTNMNKSNLTLDTMIMYRQDNYRNAFKQYARVLMMLSSSDIVLTFIKLNLERWMM